jgi:hypothetical protein
MRRAQARFRDWLIDDSHETFVVKNEGRGAAIHASYTVSAAIFVVVGPVTKGQTDNVLVKRGTPPSGYYIMARGDGGSSRRTHTHSSRWPRNVVDS